MYLVVFLVALFASAVGAVCGVGGGVIIKPVLDMLSVADVSTISFLSSCTVFSMSVYSVAHAFATGEKRAVPRQATPLAAGAALGGVGGSFLFAGVRAALGNVQMVGAVQSACLAVVTLGALVYTLKRKTLHTRQVQSMPACCGIGVLLGVMSSFLGIGGGPINLVVLHYFFSMDTKTAARSSLYVILFSQSANLLSVLLTGAVPVFAPLQLASVVTGGLLGAILGRWANRFLHARHIDRLFIGLMAVIIGICCWNMWRFVGGA